MDHLPPFAPCLIQTVLKHSFDIGSVKCIRVFKMLMPDRYLVAVLILIFEVGETSH